MNGRILKLSVALPIIFVGIVLYVGIGRGEEINYKKIGVTDEPALLLHSSTTPLHPVVTLPPPIIVTHIETPIPLKAVYMTSCIASGPRLRSTLVKLVDTTELNGLIIDIKDFSGKISFKINNLEFMLNDNGCSISDITEFIDELHKKNIYVIGRVTVMQDSTYTKSHPDSAVKRRDGSIWKDKKGLAFVDPGATEYWAHIVALAKASHAVGFDEINFDYVRFPSDGNMSDIVFTRTGSTSKPEMMKKFYAYIGYEMRTANIPSSADLFGMTTTNTDDLNIGQVLEDALLHFDYVAPMVYPSHYPPNFNGWKDPNKVPYEIINFAMSRAVERANALEAKEAGFVLSTSTPKFNATGKYANRLRPWIQDFDYGKVYTEADVRAQIKATYDSNLTSWMSWDPSNKYTPSAYNRDAKESLAPATPQ